MHGLTFCSNQSIPIADYTSCVDIISLTLYHLFNLNVTG